MINEGGGVLIDGNGTLMAYKSSVLNSNPGTTQSEAESIFKTYLGVTHFIWLDGRAGPELTDQHIDGLAIFGDSTSIFTMNEDDLLKYGVLQSDIDKLYSAKNKDRGSYDYLYLPLTQNTVKKTEEQILATKALM